MKWNYLIFLPLLTLFAACGGGGSTGDDSVASADIPKSENKKRILDYGMDPTSAEIQALVAGIEIDTKPPKVWVPELDGLSWHLTKFEQDVLGYPLIWWRFDNESDMGYHKIDCAATLYKNGETVNIMSVDYRSLSVNPGESAMRVSNPTNPVKGYDHFDKIWLSYCTFYRDEAPLGEDIVDGPVKVEFIEFIENRPGIKLSLTNNLEKAIGRVECRYNAKVGNVIVDNSTLNFKGTENRDVAAGETAVAEGKFYGSESIYDFDTTFDPANLNCSYDMRK